MQPTSVQRISILVNVHHGTFVLPPHYQHVTIRRSYSNVPDDEILSINVNVKKHKADVCLSTFHNFIFLLIFQII